ncbi:hypothetical protein SteCoe_38664 [Stentor coeruleus]|uniref:Uncharacterized protein n=1 Tax=Stentor coeruleus TaxID=5963 RepID=A0A1R2AL53_9CILI|nr:hypothetical protein SteCoe_38664 [Stentor coeruleus]
MLKCSMLGCDELPYEQCTNCDSLILCKKCIPIHFAYCFKKNFRCTFEKIKLPTRSFTELRNSIKKSISKVEHQKIKIMVEAQKIIHQIESMMKLAFDQLNNIILEYNEIYNKTEFEEEDYKRINDIIRESLDFEDPSFFEGSLTKNKKNKIERVSKEIIKNLYSLLIEGHRGEVNSVAITSDNRFVVSGSYDNTVRVWNLLEKRQEAVLEGHTSGVNTTIGSWYQEHIEGNVQVWNLVEKRQEAVLKYSVSGLNSIAITSDNRFVVLGSDDDNTVRVWSLLDKRQEAVFEGHTSGVNSVAITSDNRFVVSGSYDNTVRVWNLLEKRQEAVLEGHTYEVNSVAISSDNRFVVSGSGSWISHDNTVRVWNLLEKQQEAVFEGHTSGVNSVAIASDNRFVGSYGFSDKTVRVWNLLEKRQKAVLEGHTSYVNSVAITSDNRFVVSGSDDKTVRVWNLLEKRQEAVLEGHTSYVNSVAIINDNLCYSVSQCELILWSIKEKKALMNVPHYLIRLFSSDENFFVTTSFGYNIQVWNLVEKRQEAVLKGHTSFVLSVAITSDNRFVVSGSLDNTVRVWNLLEKRQEAVLEGHTDGVNSVAITSDNRFVVSGSSDKTVRVWSLLEKRQEAMLKDHTSYVWSVAITSDNRFVVLISSDKNVSVWNLLEKRQEAVLEGHTSSVWSVGVNSVAITSDKSRSEDNTVRVWNFFNQNIKSMVITTNDIFFNAIPSKLENKVYLSTGSGLSILNLDKKEINHDFFFDKKLEEFANDNYCFEENLLPNIV